MKKIHLLLIFLLLSFSSISYAGIENWEDTSVCLWLKSSGGGNPVPLAEAKKRGISCKDGKVVMSQNKSSEKAKLDSEALMDEIIEDAKVSKYSKTSNQLLCNWTEIYPNNQEILKEYRKRVANQKNPCQEALKEKAQLDADKLMEEVVAEVEKDQR